MARTPEDIKKGLECCADPECVCDDVCPYAGIKFPKCREQLLIDAETLVKQVPKWISVEERLPEMFVPVFVYTEENEVLNCHYDGDEWVVNYDGEYAGYDYTVTHWMPLPEPPKEG